MNTKKKLESFIQMAQDKPTEQAKHRILTDASRMIKVKSTIDTQKWTIKIMVNEAIAAGLVISALLWTFWPKEADHSVPIATRPAVTASLISLYAFSKVLRDEGVEMFDKYCTKAFESSWPAQENVITLADSLNINKFYGDSL